MVLIVPTFFAVPVVCPKSRVRAVPPPDPGTHAAPVGIHHGTNDVLHGGGLNVFVGSAAIVISIQYDWMDYTLTRFGPNRPAAAIGGVILRDFD